jgi:hypothetical protein
MSLPELDNLVRIGQLKTEPRNALEVQRMLMMAGTRLKDAKLNTLSLEGRFTSAYNAAHAAALTAFILTKYAYSHRIYCLSCYKINSKLCLMQLLQRKPNYLRT